MSKQHNYSQYSNKKKPEGQRCNTGAPGPEGKPNSKVELKTVDEIKTVIESIPATHNDPVGAPGPQGVTPARIAGIVVDCTKLNVRSEPSIAGDVVCVLDAHSELEVDLNKSNNDWYKICTAIGAEGYCMRKYINTNL